MKNKLILIILSVCTFVQLQAQAKKETAYVHGEVLLQVQKGYSIQHVLNNVQAHYNLKAIANLSKHMRFWHLQFDSLKASNADVISALRMLPSVSMVQNNHYIQERSTIPNDVSFSNQWHHVNTTGTPDADIDSDEAWDITTGGLTSQGDTIVVCIVEGGGAYWNHADLLPNFWRNYNEIDGNSVDDDGNGYIDDITGWNVNAANDNHPSGSHGTQCMGMVGAKGNNTTGVVGANWNVKLMLVSGFGVTESGVIAAYDYPLSMRKLYNASGGSAGAFVVSTSSSWGIDNANPADYPLWCAYYDTLGVHGILNVGATTNNTVNVDVVGDMPTACSSDYMISVTRTGNTDNQAGGYGLTTIDFGAPGINVYTTSGTGSSIYTTTTGTSFACPLTAGVIGLMYSVPCNAFMNLVKSDPQGGADYVRTALMNGVDPTTSMAGISVTGGRLNAFNAVNDILSNCSALSCPAPNNVNVLSVGDTNAVVVWEDGGSSLSYFVYLRPQGATVWDSTNVTDTSVTLTGLLPCTTYQFMLAAMCSSEMSAYTPVVNFTTLGCTPCDTLPYCTSSGASVVDEYIQEIQLNTLSRISGADAGYVFAQETTVLLQGEMHTFNITPGYTSASKSEYIKAWIDYDQNGVFDESTEKIYDSGTGISTSVSGLFTVPVGAVLGTTRMRVSMKHINGTDTTIPTSCLLFANGEVEDYCITIDKSDAVSDPVMSQNQWMIYPNPVNDVAIVYCNAPTFTGTSTLCLYNAVGEIVDVMPLTQRKTQVNIQHLNQGVYCYTIQSGKNKLAAGRIIVID